MGVGIDYLWQTPPFCPTPECYVHGMERNYVEHHVGRCPMSETVYGGMHLLDDEVRNVARLIGERLIPAVQEVSDVMTALWRSMPWWFRVEYRLRLHWNKLLARFLE